MANLLLTNIQTDLDYKSIKTLLDPANNFVTKINKEDGITNSVSYFVNAPLKGERIYKKNNWLIFFSGDIIENSEVPFEQIRKILEEESFEDLKVFNGIFSITAINTNSKIIYCISDLRSAHPLYYYFNENNFIISTQLSVFTSLLKNPVFNEKWLFNYFFFNYPLYEVTFLKDVYKIPPASVMKYDISNKKFNIKRYTPEFTKKKCCFKKWKD